MGMSSAIIIIITRWHEDDLVGRLTDPMNDHYVPQEARNWKIIDLPAIANSEDDPLGRKMGEVLWPSRFPKEFLEATRRADPLSFESLYQQRPFVSEGVMFKRSDFRYYDPSDLPDVTRAYVASDHAVSTRQKSDSTVLLPVFLDSRERLYLQKPFWERADTKRVVEAMLEMMRAYNPLLWWAERGHISMSIGPFLRDRMEATRTYCNISQITPVADKQTRAQAISAKIAMGHVYFPRGEEWVSRAEDQLLKFPNGSHDDFVDALAYIGLGLQNMYSPSEPKAERRQYATNTFGWVKSAALRDMKPKQPWRDKYA